MIIHLDTSRRCPLHMKTYPLCSASFLSAVTTLSKQSLPVIHNRCLSPHGQQVDADALGIFGLVAVSNEGRARLNGCEFEKAESITVPLNHCSG